MKQRLPWVLLTRTEKIRRIWINGGKAIGLIMLAYAFMIVWCAL